MKTELKCKSCKKDMPKENLDEKTKLATWFGIYNQERRENSVALAWR